MDSCITTYKAASNFASVPYKDKHLVLLKIVKYNNHS